MKTEEVIQLEDVQSAVDGHHILHGINLSIQSGGVTMLLGRNGAGKTSTLKAIMGLYPVQNGKIRFNGKAIQNQKPFQICRLGIGYVPEDQGIFYHLTVEENMKLAMLKNDETTLKRQEEQLELFPDLKRYWKDKAGILSGGQRQMLAVARAVVNENRLLLIDEPSKGLAPVVVDQLIEAINTLKQKETIILVEQNFYMATECGDACTIIDDGRVVHTGLMNDLVANEELKQKFLGIGG